MRRDSARSLNWNVEQTFQPLAWLEVADFVAVKNLIRPGFGSMKFCLPKASVVEMIDGKHL